MYMSLFTRRRPRNSCFAPRPECYFLLPLAGRVSQQQICKLHLQDSSRTPVCSNGRTKYESYFVSNLDLAATSGFASGGGAYCIPSVKLLTDA